jgi:hypothetical protein
MDIINTIMIIKNNNSSGSELDWAGRPEGRSSNPNMGKKFTSPNSPDWI